MDSTRFVRVGGCLLGGNLLLQLLLLSAEPSGPGPWRVVVFALLGWVLQASLVLGAVMLVAGLVLRALGLLPRVVPADVEPAIDHYS